MLIALAFCLCSSQVQRIPRYVLLLRELKKHTAPDHPDLAQLNFALTKIESIAAHVNESKRHVENMSKLLDIQSRVKDPKFQLFKPDRRLLREGMIKRVSEKYVLSDAVAARPPHEWEMLDQLLFLFNDMLLWTTPAFDITGFVDLVALTSLPTTFDHVSHTICLNRKQSSFGGDMVFACKDAGDFEQWKRFLVNHTHMHMR